MAKRNQIEKQEAVQNDSENQRGLVFLDASHFGIRVMKNGKLMVRLSRRTCLVLSEEYLKACFENFRKKGAA